MSPANAMKPEEYNVSSDCITMHNAFHNTAAALDLLWSWGSLILRELVPEPMLVSMHAASLAASTSGTVVIPPSSVILV
ncbi:MAG: hypothetical protein CL912_28335 [Deltaproteobacteria bacterium]|nr:hypothetical protein [Deltaproteobacteria bacterium]